nr:hypothetical protein [Tanacetum cinerariifolium]
MFKDNSYKAHDDHKNLFEALQKSLEHDYSNQLLADLDEARRTKRKRNDLPRTSFMSPPLHPPPPPPLAGAFGAPETYPTDYLMNDDSIPNEQVHLSDDEDTRNDHLPKADMGKDWWKPLPEEERPATPKPAWTIPSSNVSDVENNWATALVSTYVPPAGNLLLAKTGDMMTFINWYCQKMEECHKILIDHINWVNLEGDQVKIDVSRPLPLDGLPGHALQKSLEHDYSNQLLADLDEARRTKRKRNDLPRTSFMSPPLHPPPPPPLAGAFGAPGTLGALRSSQLSPPLPLPSTNTNQGN